MKVNVNELKNHLSGNLAPVYVVSGDEPLQQGEACDAIRAAARQQNFTERNVFHVEKGFDWDSFLAMGNSLSLFADRQLIELRMPNGKPGDKGSKALLEYAQNPSPDSILLVITGKLDKQTQRSKWFTQLESAGVFIAVWPIATRQLAGWTQQRARSRGMKLTPAAVQVIVDRVEGNMLAAAQEIDKLQLLFGSSEIDEHAVMEAVSDSARYDIYGLVDVALSGDVNRVTRMVDGLRAEGVEPILASWALAREIRALYHMSLAVARGSRPEQAVAQARVWPQRKAFVTQALKRHNVASWQAMLQHAAKIDRIIKGLAAGNVWDELLQLSLGMAGIALFREPAVL
ncbi:MAG: DNA polymerase III subunit delta [Gammaproteobacteria bacterium]|jgi:DNA polymerase-3 subunit delta